MSRKHYFIGKLDYYARLSASSYGNPRYFAHFTNERGEELEGKTASNAACAYGFLNDITQLRSITYHYTRKGNVIIDYVQVLR